MPRRKSNQPKTDYHILLAGHLVEQIATRATARKQTATQVITDLIAGGIAAEEAAKMERGAMPIMRAALGEDQALALDELRKQIRADVREDIQVITGKQTDRLASLQVRVGRSAALTWRLLFRMIQKQFGNAIAEDWYTEARDQAGKSMAASVSTTKEIDK